MVSRYLYSGNRYLKGIIAPPAPGWGVPGFKGLFDINWIKVVFRTNEVDMLAVAGWDAVVYLRILHFGKYNPLENFHSISAFIQLLGHQHRLPVWFDTVNETTSASVHLYCCRGESHGLNHLHYVR